MMGGGMMSTQGQSVPIDQAIQTMKVTPQYATLLQANNTIVFNSKSIALVALTMGHERASNLTGRTPPAYSSGDVFVIYGLINPTIVIPRGASLEVTVVNLDEDMYHNFIVATASPPYPYVAMQRGIMASGYQGGWLAMMPFLPPADYPRGIAHEYSYSFVASAASSLWYLCTYPGHAQEGMYGEIHVN